MGILGDRDLAAGTAGLKAEAGACSPWLGAGQVEGAVQEGWGGPGPSGVNMLGLTRVRPGAGFEQSRVGPTWLSPGPLWLRADQGKRHEPVRRLGSGPTRERRCPEENRRMPSGG